MKTNLRFSKLTTKTPTIKIKVVLVALFAFTIISCLQARATTKTSTGNGNWSSSSTWSPSGVPASTDNVVIDAGDVVTVDGNYTCNNLSIGANQASTLQITTSGKSLTINGALTLNTNGKNHSYILDAGPGTINIAGTIASLGTRGNNYIKVGTGTINFTPDVTISNNTQSILFTGAGTINFNGNFTDQYNGLTPYSGCTVNFSSSYTVNTTSATWGDLGTANFKGSNGTIIATNPITFNNLIIQSGDSVQVSGSCTTNYLTIGNGGTGNAVLQMQSAGSSITVKNDVTIMQPTTSSTTNSLRVDAGTCDVTGNLIYSGTSTSSSKIGKVNITSGVFTLDGTITWMSASSSAVSVLDVSTGTVNFNSSVSMGSGSGTINVTGAATVNFNGTTPPSLAFGGSTAPVFTTVSGANINFAKGFSATTTALTFATGTNVSSGSAASPVDFTVTGSNTVTNNGSLTIYGDLVGSNSNSTFVNGANATLTLNGNVMSTGKLNASAAGNTIIYNGSSTQTVKVPISSYNNIVFSNTGTKTLAGDITANGVTLTSGTLDDAGHTITISGASGWTNNGGTYTTTGGVAFTGSTASQIGGTTTTSFNNYTMNKSGGVTLNAPAIINGALTLTNGVITTTTANNLQLSATATASAGSASAYVDGPMTKIGNTTFTFPTGNGGRWRRVGVTGMTSPTTAITAQYFSATPPSTSLLSNTLSAVGTNEYWDVERTVTTDPIKIQLYWESTPLSSLLSNCSTLTVAHFKGGMWQQESATMISGPLTCLLGSSGSIQTDWVSTFSPFGFGGSGGGSLPIKLVSFDAVANGNIVETKWVTQLEINNAYFTLERSTDVQNWEEVGRVDGAGNSTAIHSYSQPDLNPIHGTSYYRLKQTDYNGQFTYSNIVPVTTEGAKSDITLYPNPTDNELFLNVSNPSDEIKVEIYDMTGRKMYAQIFPADKGNNNRTITLQAKYLLPTGVYMLCASTNGVEHRERLILN